MRKKKPEDEGNSERWLLTYSDMITLLMVFFIIMYAMSTVNQKKYEAFATSMNSTMGNGSVGTNVLGQSGGYAQSNAVIDTVAVPNDTSQSTGDSTSKEKVEETKLSNLKEEVDKFLNQSGLSNSVTTQQEEKGVIITIQDAFFFDSGQADIKSGYAEKLSGIASILNKVDNFIIVEGYTDNVPINKGKFSDNRDLGYARAKNVVTLLQSKASIPDSKIAPESFGDSFAKASNDTEEGRAKNRRVEIVILNNKYSVAQNGNK